MFEFDNSMINKGDYISTFSNIELNDNFEKYVIDRFTFKIIISSVITKTDDSVVFNCSLVRMSNDNESIVTISDCIANSFYFSPYILFNNGGYIHKDNTVLEYPLIENKRLSGGYNAISVYRYIILDYKSQYDNYKSYVPIEMESGKLYKPTGYDRDSFFRKILLSFDNPTRELACELRVQSLKDNFIRMIRNRNNQK
jgi:hypothetical protein